MSTNPVDTPDERERVEGLWFEDGNLILQAENSLFRIYSGFLAARSSVFRDMLAFPPPEEGNTIMDGCYIVPVYDSAKDMTYFLKAIIDSAFFEPPPSATELPIVEGVLRLSLKYDVQYLRKRALQHLHTTFPLTLRDWKVRDQNRTIPSIENTPFAALRIASEFDLIWLLPSILYCISSHPLEKTLDGAKWEDETINLGWADKRMCLVGRSKLLLAQSRNAMAMTKTADLDVEGCTGSSHTCASTRARCADILIGWGVAGFLDYFEDNTEVYSTTFCLMCRNVFKDQCASASQSMWHDLPGMFDLPTWEDLEKLKMRAFE
ncbi:hypothetical protein B0H34DRAFT_668422 [Crassisporium funariophilum]|nr:hypothetical protein B0H34DRAFT_668422 [Crassisporium funariophilum]